MHFCFFAMEVDFDLSALHFPAHYVAMMWTLNKCMHFMNCGIDGILLIGIHFDNITENFFYFLLIVIYCLFSLFLFSYGFADDNLCS